MNPTPWREDVRMEMYLNCTLLGQSRAYIWYPTKRVMIRFRRSHARRYSDCRLRHLGVFLSGNCSKRVDRQTVPQSKPSDL